MLLMFLDLNYNIFMGEIIENCKKKLKKELQPHYHERICGDQKDSSLFDS